MTVRRNARETFDVGRDRLAERVREVLREDPIYRDTIEHEDGALFTTEVKPSFWGLGTAMHVALEQDNGADSPRTMVDLTTVSQPWIMGDAFGIHDRYIRDFLTALRHRVEASSGTPPAAVRRRGSIKNEYELVILVLAVLLFVLLPAALALAGLGLLVIYVFSWPVGFAAGWALAGLADDARRRFSRLIVAPIVAAAGFVVAFALLIVAGFATNDLFFGRNEPAFNGASGLLLGVLLGGMSRSRPEGHRR